MLDYLPSEIDYQARVNAGISLLDEKWPEWWRAVNVVRLNIASGNSCLTAQAAQILGIGEDWMTGMDYFALDDESYILHGFNGESTPFIAGKWQEGWEEYEHEDACAVLTALWKNAIRERRKTAGLSITL